MDVAADLEEDSIDDILDATIEEPEEADDDITYDGEEEDDTPMIKTIRIPVHPLTDIPEPSSDIAVTYKFLTGMWVSVDEIALIGFGFGIGIGIGIGIGLDK